MKKKTCLIFQLVLLAWFLLDMTGISFDGYCLVTRSYTDDGIFFIIYLAAVLIFLLKEKIGKWIMTGWLSMWFITQFLSHEWYTLFGSGFMGPVDSKMETFSGTVHWLDIPGRYIPDVYHTVLHILILAVLAVTVIYTVQSKKTQK